MRDRNYSPCPFPGADRKLKGLHQVYALWAWDTEGLQVLEQTTPFASSYSEREAQPSYLRSGRSSDLERGKEMKTKM